MGAHGRERVLDASHDGVPAPEVVQDDDRPARAGDAPHLAEDRDRVGDRADHVGRQRGVELPVPEVHGRGVHHLERHLVHPEVLDLLLGLPEHPLREVDPDQVHPARVERQVETRPDPDLEQPAPELGPDQADRGDPARLEDLAEHEVVDGGVEIVRAPDLMFLEQDVQFASRSGAASGTRHAAVLSRRPRTAKPSLPRAAVRRPPGTAYCGCKNRRNSVASPRKERNPEQSVKVVTTTPLATAGSTRRSLRATGTRVPVRAATSMFVIIARPRMRPSSGSPFQRYAITPATSPVPAPFASPMTASRKRTFRVFATVRSPSAMARTITVNVWIPAFPPMPATIGMKTARAANAWIDGSKSPTTVAARTAVGRFTSSQKSRRRATFPAGSKIVSSAETPPRWWMSSVASSWMTSMTSSTVMVPSRRLSRLTTGTASRLCLVTSRATSSWSVSAVTLITSGRRIAWTGVAGSAVIRRRSGTTPTRWSWLSTTYTWKTPSRVTALRRCSSACATVMSSWTATNSGVMIPPAVDSPYWRSSWISSASAGGIRSRIWEACSSGSASTTSAASSGGISSRIR